MIRGLIFDLDGTLVDSLPGIASALNHSLTDFGLPTHSTAAVRGFIGDGIGHLVSRALGDTENPTADEVVAGFQKHYPTDWKTGTEPYPGMLELLEEFHGKNIPMAVLSNKPHHYTCEIVEHLFPGHLFDHIQGDKPEFPRKPDPASSLHIANLWQIDPAEIAFVGDSTIDLATAKAAHMQALIFSWGYGTPEDYPLIDSISELRDAVIRS